MVKWGADEEEALCAGVKKHGKGKWKKILKDPHFSPILSHRSNIDIKDKWRNMEVKLKADATNLLIDEKNQSPSALVDEQQINQVPEAFLDEQIDQENQVPEAFLEEQIDQENQVPEAFLDEQQINQENQVPEALVDEQIDHENQVPEAFHDEQINQENQVPEAFLDADTSMIPQEAEVASPYKIFLLEVLIAVKDSTESDIHEFLEFIEQMYGDEVEKFDQKNKLITKEDVELLHQVIGEICRKYKKQKTDLGSSSTTLDGDV